MINYLQKQINNYSEFKKELDTALNNTANNIVQAGYLLIKARDTDILKESGYSGMGEFAQKEYGLSPDQTSRFIGIAERFGDGEGRLQEKFQGYGYTKLSEMLTLTDTVIEALPEEITRDEIRDLKAEIKAEEQITPIEMEIERCEEKQNTPEGREEWTQLNKFFLAYFRPEEHAEEFYHAIDVDWAEKWGEAENKRVVLDALAPSGIGILEARIPGEGRFMLSFKGESTLPAFVNIRDDKSEEVEWKEVREGFSGLTEYYENSDLDRDDEIRQIWQKLYDQPFPQKSVKNEPENEHKQEKASEKPEKASEKSAKVSVKTEKSSKTVKIAPAQPKPETDKSDAPITVTGPKDSEEPVMNPPEEEADQSSKLDQNTIRGYKAGLTSDINTLERMNRDNQWRPMRTKLQGMLQTVNRIIDSEEGS